MTALGWFLLGVTVGSVIMTVTTVAFAAARRPPVMVGTCSCTHRACYHMRYMGMCVVSGCPCVQFLPVPDDPPDPEVVRLREMTGLESNGKEKRSA